MRRLRVLVSATAQEILSEPLALLTTLASLVLATLAPAMHYHQFGEASRMARDAGFSALLLGGAVIAVFCTVKTFRREIEGGTAAVALAHSVSRTTFFLAKTLGCALGYLVFALSVACVSLTVVNGAEIGGAIAAAKGDIARLWGPSFACAVAAIVGPILIAAALNRFLRFRFTLSASWLTLLAAVGGAAYRFDAGLAARFLPAAALVSAPALVLLAAAAAFAVRFRANAAATGAALTALALLPALGSYCLSDALTEGGRVGGGYCALALAALAPAVAAFLVFGVREMIRNELS